MLPRPRAFLLIVALIITGCAGAKTVTVTPPPPPPVNADYTITGTFTFDFTNNFACSPSVTTGCVSGFAWGYMNGATLVNIASLTEPIPVCSATVTQNCAIAATTQPTAFNFQGNSQLPVGAVNFGADTLSITNAGAAVTSSVDTTTTPTNIAAGSVANLAVTSVK